jgi:choline dehydrogenase-like flavoprotein
LVSANGHPGTDVLVIGAGAAGSVASRYLAEAGFRVVCLEQGGWVNASEFPGDKTEYELLARFRWSPNPNVRRRPDDYPCDVTESDLEGRMFSGVGGTTLLYAGHWLRQLPSDFRVRSLDGVAVDWPMTYEELEPYYVRAEQQCAVSGLGGDPAYPPREPPPLPPLPINEAGRRAAEGMNKLGWHWWPGSNAIASRPQGNLSRCARFGTCMHGCPEGAKASFDLTHWPQALSNGARLITKAHVTRITTAASGRATGAHYLDSEGQEHEERADVVILAANGVGTPRLLLLSASNDYPDGLANSSGLVGKNLMLHPYTSVLGIYDEDLESWLGPNGQLIQSMQFYETDGARGFVRGGKWSARPTGGPLSVMTTYEGLVWGPDLHDRVAARVGRSIEWGVIAEDLPAESNCVELDPVLTDRFDTPAPRLVYRMSANTLALLDFHVDRMREAHEAAGASETVNPTQPYRASGHLLGTARMGDDPATSVVDSFGRAHDVPNLFICDGAIFPTSSGVNPTATIAALALRCAEHIAQQAPLQPVPA